MEKNEGLIDRTIRLIVGIFALYLAFTYSLWWLVLAVPALLTAITGFCLPYKLLGISTLKKEPEKNKIKKIVKKNK